MHVKNQSLKRLRELHRALDEEIASEERHPHPDQDHINRLKRDKLHLRDEMESRVIPETMAVAS